MEDFENAQRVQAQAQKGASFASSQADPVTIELDTIRNVYWTMKSLEAPARVRIWRYLAELLPVND